jgi:protein SCO1/2
MPGFVDYREHRCAILRASSPCGASSIVSRNVKAGGPSGQWQPRPKSRAHACFWALSLALAFMAIGCQGRKQQPPPGIFGPGTDAYCLPSASFVDQHGDTINFASLKGKWILVDFIYTRCPGPCELMTNKLVQAANHLTADLGKNIEFVSITLDPEHDGPKQLLQWARALGAERKGWLFLSGSLQNVEKVMTVFRVRRVVRPGGTINHVIEFFLVGPQGHERRQYSPNEAAPNAVAQDLITLAAQGRGIADESGVKSAGVLS